MNLKMIQPKNQTEELWLPITKIVKFFFEQTHTKPKELLEFKIGKPRETLLSSYHKHKKYLNRVSLLKNSFIKKVSLEKKNFSTKNIITRNVLKWKNRCRNCSTEFAGSFISSLI